MKVSLASYVTLKAHMLFDEAIVTLSLQFIGILTHVWKKIKTRVLTEAKNWEQFQHIHTVGKYSTIKTVGRPHLLKQNKLQGVMFSTKARYKTECKRCYHVDGNKHSQTHTTRIYKCMKCLITGRILMKL